MQKVFITWTYVDSFVVCFFISPTARLSIDCFKAGAMVGFNVISAVSNGGRSNALGFTGSGILTGSSSSSMIFGAGFSGSIGLTFECLDSWQPFMFKNSVKSTLFLLQHDQPLYASWKNGTPGWWRHASTKTNNQSKHLQRVENSKKKIRFKNCIEDSRTIDQYINCAVHNLNVFSLFIQAMWRHWEQKYSMNVCAHICFCFNSLKMFCWNFRMNIALTIWIISRIKILTTASIITRYHLALFAQCNSNVYNFESEKNGDSKQSMRNELELENANRLLWLGFFIRFRL